MEEKRERKQSRYRFRTESTPLASLGITLEGPECTMADSPVPIDVGDSQHNRALSGFPLLLLFPERTGVKRNPRSTAKSNNTVSKSPPLA